MNNRKGINKKTINIRKEDLVWHSFDDLLKKWMKNKDFREGYEEALARRRMAHQVRSLRTAKKMTQKAVAEKAEMPQSVIARIESGEHSASFETISRIAHALGKKVELV